MACKTRLDITKRDIQDTRYTIEIGVSTIAGTAGSTIAGTGTIGAATFMEVMLGTDSDWASGLGTNFEQSLKAKYDLNSRSKRAWWVSYTYMHACIREFTYMKRSRRWWAVSERKKEWFIHLTHDYISLSRARSLPLFPHSLSVYIFPLALSFSRRIHLHRWINPGHKWPDALAYTLPSNIMVAMLVGINENGANRRHTLITSGSDSPTTTHPISTHQGHTTQYVYICTYTYVYICIPPRDPHYIWLRLPHYCTPHLTTPVPHYTGVCIHVYIYIYIFICIYIYTHLHTHVHVYTSRCAGQ